ncbi:MAG: polyketide synthase dehydratase domain-containing protein, partial [Armatimonadetes bacterium]|nr:polyketide synthase dehydratase domain-containing protein [Armatimonadota bacterium]
INWGPWEGGMVTPALRKEFERLGVGLIPLLAGAECMVAELGSGSLDEVEVLIGDGFPEPAAPANNGRAQGTSASVNGRPPLTLTVSKRISREELSCLGSHIIGGRPVLPMALMLEWFGQAALQSQLGMKLRGLDHFRVYRGVTLEGTEPVQLGIYLAPPRNDGDLVEIDLELRGIASGTLHAGATALLGSTDPQRAPGRLDEALHREPYPHAPAAIYRDLLFHGPGLHAVRSVRGWSAAGMVAELAAAPRPSEWERDPLRTEWVTDPMAVDGALQLGILWCLESLGKPSLPSGGQRYRQYARFPEQGVTAALAVSEHSPHRLVADVSFFDAEGQLVARFEGLEWTADAGLRKAFAREVVA